MFFETIFVDKKVPVMNNRANLSLEELGESFPDSETGIYAGWAQVDGKDIHKMVMSVGWYVALCGIEMLRCKSKLNSSQEPVLQKHKEDMRTSYHA